MISLAPLAAVILASLVSKTNAAAYGFATGVTGGGSATAAAPSDIAQLKTWLADSTARVILINKTFNFKGSEGTATSSGCYQSSCPVSSGGQDYIGTISCSGSNMLSTTITYDVAGATPLVVASSKTILGVGSAGIIQGKGLRLPATTTNVIIQNIHITDINPSHVWGGDALQLEGNKGVWIDHNKFSLIGRQFIVSHYAASQFTVSNNEFYGVTTTSAVCNGDHYWTNMFIGPGDLITIDRNYYHDVSGRAPKLGESGVRTTVHATNNLFYNMAGHAFDIYSGTYALIEGNAFITVTTPMASQTGAIYNVPDSTSASTCSSYLGRNCQLNAFGSNVGTWPSLTNTAVLDVFKVYDTKYIVTPISGGSVTASVVANAGIGKI
ncbi:pectin lyase [Cadophora sp. MPI-SDFR-AT-0126]|nr:pectin lyase [Leotiomycetes sp. MPI-SDFR-AT-0126]